MNKRIIYTLLIGFLLLCTGCGKNLKPNSVSTSVNQFAINETSKIEDDFLLFNLGMKEGSEELALSDLVVMFPTDTECYLYFAMPVDSQLNAYRVNEITIDGQVYPLALTEVDGYYQKYKLSGFQKNDSNEYKVTKLTFYNEKRENDTQTYNMSQNIMVLLDEENFIFNQEHEYSITLAGQCFESIYQFNKDNNKLVDLWANVIGNVEALDADKRSFFYFAFKCYDVERDIYFVPDDILKLEVEYDRLSYEYQGKEQESAENIIPTEKTIRDTIKPDEVKVVAADEKKSNKRLYKYNTINKLSEADFSKNVDSSNAAVLKQAAKEYDWAVQFGAKEGYPYKNTEAGILWGRQYDISYTKIKNFNTIHIVYRYEGKKVKTGTNSLIKDDTVDVPEKHRPPTDAEEFITLLITPWVNPNISLSEKIIQTIQTIIKPILLIAIFIIIIRTILKLRKSSVLQKVGKYAKKRIEEKLDEVIDEKE